MKGLYSDTGLKDVPVIGNFFTGAENVFNGGFNLLNNLEGAAGKIANVLKDLFQTPYFLIILLLIGGFLV